MVRRKISRASKATAAVIVALLIVAAGVALTGFIVIQPIGALPEGGTIWYFRVATNLPFIQSPDGLSLDTTGSLSLFSRMAAMSALMEVVESRKIVSFAYSEWMYLRSTDGRRFD